MSKADDVLRVAQAIAREVGLESFWGDRKNDRLATPVRYRLLGLAEQALAAAATFKRHMDDKP